MHGMSPTFDQGMEPKVTGGGAGGFLSILIQDISYQEQWEAPADGEVTFYLWGGGAGGTRYAGGNGAAAKKTLKVAKKQKLLFTTGNAGPPQQWVGGNEALPANATDTILYLPDGSQVIAQGGRPTPNSGGGGPAAIATGGDENYNGALVTGSSASTIWPTAGAFQLPAIQNVQNNYGSPGVGSIIISDIPFARGLGGFAGVVVSASGGPYSGPGGNAQGFGASGGGYGAASGVIYAGYGGNGAVAIIFKRNA